MKSTENIDDLLAKRFSHEILTKAQDAELEEWIEMNQDEYKRLEKLIGEGVRQKEIKFDETEAWEKVEPELRSVQQLRMNRIFAVATIAASILLIVGITTWIQKSCESKLFVASNTETVNQTIILPDSSKVILYPGAKIGYRTIGHNGKRLLSLSGKSFFDIKRNTNRPFIISAFNIRIEVVGTSFFVDAKKRNEAQVIVKSGTVKVSSKWRNVMLTKNQQVDVSDGKLKKTEMTDAERIFEEKPQTLKLEDTPVAEVVQKLQKIYQVRIELGKDVEKNKITTQLQLNDLDNILKELSYLCSCKYEKKNNRHYKLYYEQDKE